MYTQLSEPQLVQTHSISDSAAKYDVFWRSAKWCWDGSAVLATREDNSLQVWNDPSALASSSITIPQPAPVLDAVWYPGARTSDAPSYCFVASIRDTPIRLLDGTNGRLRASYKIIDHVERFVAPHSMAFNCTADKLYCGHRDAIEMFDIQYPGEGERIKTSSSKKSKSGMRGIVSSLAFCPDYSGIYAAGSFTSALWLFAEGQGAQPVCRLKGIASAITQVRPMLRRISAHATQVKFNPAYPQLLYAACRQRNSIYAWDTRNPSAPYATYERKSSTNQKLWIDVDASGTWLVTGGTDGSVSFFNLTSELEVNEPEHSFHAHDDAVGSVALHPIEMKLLTVSGSRHFEETAQVNEGSDSDFKDDVQRHVQRVRPVAFDATMKIWDI
ncbi:WD40 repeat-like protein [Exidia glandulosa HHB12029]|uniref:WD40 repeat-like protein n=1 Tax=Exidia glandulosa HHB12029 TaxID=1314781 RepID=A0A166ATC9_EXIGL|nr:WD40 repeat-like protein [Exidia glandulosa HHB12029]